jgi:hypothetical protein
MDSEKEVHGRAEGKLEIESVSEISLASLQPVVT